MGTEDTSDIGIELLKDNFIDLINSQFVSKIRRLHAHMIDFKNTVDEVQDNTYQGICDTTLKDVLESKNIGISTSKLEELVNKITTVMDNDLNLNLDLTGDKSFKHIIDHILNFKIGKIYDANSVRIFETIFTLMRDIITNIDDNMIHAIQLYVSFDVRPILTQIRSYIDSMNDIDEIVPPSCEESVEDATRALSQAAAAARSAGTTSVDCRGDWGDCNDSCKQVYSIDTEASGEGTQCPHDNGDIRTCTGGDCPEESSIDWGLWNNVIGVIVLVVGVLIVGGIIYNKYNDSYWWILAIIIWIAFFWLVSWGFGILFYYDSSEESSEDNSE